MKDELQLTRQTVSPAPLSKNVHVAFAALGCLVLLVAAVGIARTAGIHEARHIAPNAAPSILPTVVVHDEPMTIGRSGQTTYLNGKLVLHGKCGDITLDASEDRPNIIVSDSWQGSGCAPTKPIDFTSGGVIINSGI